MAKIVWTQESLDWLEKIYYYIAEDNPDAAKRVIDGIYNKTRMLSDFPKIGFCLKQFDEKEVRGLLFEHYRIAYYYDHRDTIYVLGIFHGSMSIEKISEHWPKQNFE